MTYQVHGELTADGTRIVLIAASEFSEAVIEAAKLLQTLTPLIKPTDPPGAVTLPVSWPAVVQLAHTFADAWRPGPRLAAWTAAEFARRTTDLDAPLSIALPPGLTPRPYQVAGAHLIAAVGSVLLLDEAGTGKTITTILGLLERQHRTGRIAPVVVVCPASVVDPWVDAWRTWAPHCTTVAWRGARSTRARLASRAHVYVVSYDTARNDAASPSKGPAPLLVLAPASVVIDECHLIKSSDAHRSHAVRRLARTAQTVVALSGTPITHHPGDLWPTLVALSPHAWPSKERWVARYCDTVTGDYTSTVLGLTRTREPEFRTALLGAHRRVAKADVLTQLPPKVYSVRTVALPAAWRRAYDDMEAQMLAQLPDDGGELSVMSVLAQLTRLSQLASAAADVTVSTGRDDDGQERDHVTVTLKAPSWKVDALLEVLAERPGKPVVAFAPSRQLMVLAGETAAKAGHSVGYVIGGQPMRERTATVEAFQAGRLDLLCVTTGAGGVGITLTAAGTAVFLQRPWSLVEALQAEDRCFAAGTPVLTADGWVPIENVRVGDMVVTRTGRLRPVLDAWSQQSTRLMTEVAITGQDSVTCTADHQFLTVTEGWKAAEDLRPGDWLAMPSNDIQDELTELCFGSAYLSPTFQGPWGRQRNGRLKPAPQIIKVSDDFLFVLGFFAGDGFASITSDKGRFLSFAGNRTTKLAALDRCERWASSVGMAGKRALRPHSGSVEQRFYSGEWAHWFHDAFGARTGAAYKRLPAFVLQLNERQSRAVLEGLAASDGYRRNGGPCTEYATVSRTLAANVALLAMRAGYRPSRTLGSTGQSIVSVGGTPGPRSAGRVRSVLLRHPTKPNGVRERVYDLTVAEDATFVVGNVVVHNCHRIGSETHESIEIIDVVASNTIDSRVRAVLRDKAGQLADLVQDRRVVTELLGGRSVPTQQARRAA